MAIGPIRDSPSRLQRWLASTEPRYSAAVLAAMFSGGMMVPILLGYPGMVGHLYWFGPAGILFMYVVLRIWGPYRRMTREERLDEVGVYLPAIRLPTLTKRYYLLYPICGLFGGLWIAVDHLRGMFDRGVTMDRLIVTGGMLASLAMMMAIILRSVRYHLVSRGQ